MQIARRADELRVTGLAQLLSVPVLMHPSLPILTHTLAVSGLPSDADMPVNLLDDTGSGLQLSARDILTTVTTLTGDSVTHDLMSGAMLGGAVRVGDMIDKFKFRDAASPLMEFARHFRNACAHGDQWSFKGAEPKHPASTQRLVLDASMNGIKATWTTVSPLEYFRFLDEIHAHFLNLALHQCMREVVESRRPADDLAAVSEKFYASVRASGFPQENQDFLAKMAFTLYAGLSPWPTITPKSYGADTEG